MVSWNPPLSPVLPAELLMDLEPVVHGILDPPLSPVLSAELPLELKPVVRGILDPPVSPVLPAELPLELEPVVRGILDQVLQNTCPVLRHGLLHQNPKLSSIKNQHLLILPGSSVPDPDSIRLVDPYPDPDPEGQI